MRLRLKKSANKAFKSDSQRLAVSLRSSIAKRRSHLNAALCDSLYRRYGGKNKGFLAQFQSFVEH
ncbi:hypothetical protein C1S99_25565 [Vibrio parahaemolyticus]|nr:hypothetical protein C1T12_25640 [Vibrio parahaemolyticus]PMS57341.1 hypothetical protein C1S91_26160 [Vibrio parahaemolyticus]PMS65250.1 hypothetical protein C1S96_25915 [Vibrio parahaemolyticus]PMS70507.1 hypothetical protein C1T10_25625 [Vibrio parahaemolyticus]PMS73709.1 hypothetical protein C1S88_25375 [Vibrio parahaemolyticus]